MKKRIYLIRKTVAEDEEKLLEVSGKEFYDFVNSVEKEKRYFIRIVDDFSYEGTEIIAQTSPEMYKSWRKEYDAHRYSLLERDTDDTKRSSRALWNWPIGIT